MSTPEDETYGGVVPPERVEDFLKTMGWTHYELFCLNKTMSTAYREYTVEMAYPIIGGPGIVYGATGPPRCSEGTPKRVEKGLWLLQQVREMHEQFAMAVAPPFEREERSRQIEAATSKCKLK